MSGLQSLLEHLTAYASGRTEYHEFHALKNNRRDDS